MRKEEEYRVEERRDEEYRVKERRDEERRFSGVTSRLMEPCDLHEIGRGRGEGVLQYV